MTQLSIPDSNSDVLVFKAAGQRLALPLTEIAEIMRPSAITRVPNGPAELLGVANFRGAVVPIVSANALFGGEIRTAGLSARVIIVKGKSTVGLMVEEVSTLEKSSDAGRIDLDALLAKSFRSKARPDLKVVGSPEPEDRFAAEGHSDLVFLAFELAHQEFAFAIEQVEGIASLPSAIARLPRTDQAMLGAAEIGGSLVPLVSLRFLLGFPINELDDTRTRVVLIRLGEAVVGVIVDGVNDILRIGPDALDPVPSVLTRARGEAQIEAICRLNEGRRLVSILSPAKLFDAETVARVVAETEIGSSKMSSDETKALDVEQFIVFQLGDESYGLPIGSVEEVVRCPDILTRVPNAPRFVSGLMNLRGKAVPVIDQRQRFSANGSSERSRGRIVVVTVDGLKTGFLVDNVSEVLTVPTSEVTTAPELASDAAQVIDRVAMVERNGHMILLVDPKALLDRAERDVLESISSNTPEAPRSL